MPDQEKIADVLRAIASLARCEPARHEYVALEISRMVRVIQELAVSDQINREGESVISFAMNRFYPADATPRIIDAARLSAAISRFELALRQSGYLPDRRRDTLTVLKDDLDRQEVERLVQRVGERRKTTYKSS